MKKLLLAACIVVMACSAWATITLTTPETQTYTMGGSTVETNDTASVISMTTNYPNHSITVVLQPGHMNGGVFIAGQHGQPLTVVIYADSGQVSVSDGRANIMLTSTQQAAVLNYVKSNQNTVENELLSLGVLSGTQVAN